MEEEKEKRDLKKEGLKGKTETDFAKEGKNIWRRRGEENKELKCVCMHTDLPDECEHYVLQMYY